MAASNIIWGIASYHRPDRQPMLNLLTGMGYTKEEIVLSTQTEEDYKEYSDRYADQCQVIYAEGHNVSDNKNTLLQYVIEQYPGKRLVMLSDKVRGIGKMKGKNIEYIKTREELDSLVKKAFYITKQLGGSVFGVYPVGNAFYMSHSININQQLLGCFMGFPNPSKDLLFDPEQPLKEDYELSLRIIQQGGKVVRFNDLCLLETLHTEGGCHEWWNAEGDKKNEECTMRILNKYPQLVVPHSTRKNELRYTGKSLLIKKSILD